MRSPNDSFAIVLCTFNGARFLDAQLASLRVQAGVAEIIAVDDGSTDGTLAILERHAAVDRRLVISQNPSRLGVNRNFEHAISLARSPWIALADQDDVWLPGKLARLRAEWDGRSCLVHHPTRKFRGALPTTLPSPAGERRKFAGADLRRLLYRNTIVGHTILARADVLHALAPFPAGVPYDWWIGVGAAAIGTVQYVDEYLVLYRIHENNAYHPAGSRVRRLRDEHRLRLSLLDALAGAPRVGGAPRDFVEHFRRLLVAASPRVFSWRLWRFYWRHAAILFGERRSPVSWFTALRKSVGATCGAMAQAPVPVDALTLERPAFSKSAAAASTLKKVG